MTLPEGAFSAGTSARPVEIAVVGGGIAGCTIAFELASCGRSVLLAADRVVLANGRWMSDLLRSVEGNTGFVQGGLTTGRGWLVRTSQPREEIPWIIEEMSWLPQAAPASTRWLAQTMIENQPRPEMTWLSPARCAHTV